MEFTINSRTLGRTVTFSRPGAYYVYADLNGLPGTLGQQICRNGSCISYSGDDLDGFERICRRWYRQHLRSLRMPYGM